MRELFPLLKNHPSLVYLDSAATALKPVAILEAEQKYATHFGTNAARGLYPLAEATDTEVHQVRQQVATLVGAEAEEIIFTNSTTAGMNMLAQSFFRSLTQNSSSPTLISEDAHHSQVLPWVEENRGQPHAFVSVNSEGFLDQEDLRAKLSSDTPVIVLSFVSNVFGVIQPLDKIIKSIRSVAPNAFVVVDAAQAVGHVPFSFQELDADALVFSGHKIYGSTGVGICVLKKSWQKILPAAVFGGGMVLDTSTKPLTYKTGPEKFEAGTLPLSQIFGLGAAVSFLQTIGATKIREHDQELTDYTITKLVTAFGRHVQILGTLDPQSRTSLVSFTLTGVHPHDIASILGDQNICVRAGEHCASFLHRSLGIPATTRVSFGIYTTKKDIDLCIAELEKVFEMFRK
jgi:cysteine desulfurase / selenocysteine lyase